MDILEDMMSCAICAYPFECSGERLPKMLPCQHSFCVQCLEGVYKNGSIRCPMCRSNYKSAVDQLPQNLLLVQMISAMPKPTKADELGVEKLKLEGGSSGDDEVGSSSTLEEGHRAITKNKDYMDPVMAIALLKSVLFEVQRSKFEEDRLDLVLDCMRHYRENKNIAVLEEAAECLGYMQVHFIHRIPKFCYKEIAQEALDTLQMVGLSAKLRTSCVYIIFVYTKIKHAISDKLSTITTLFNVYDVKNDTGVIEQGIMAAVRLLCRKLTAEDRKTLSTTDHIRKLIWVLSKKIHGGSYDSTLNDALTISLYFIDSDKSSQDFVTNHGASYIALLLEKKLSIVPGLCRQMTATPKLTSNLQLHLSWEDKDHVQVTRDVVTVITNLLLVPKSQWESEEESADKYDTLVEELSYLFTSKTSTDVDFDGISNDLLITMYPLLEETGDEAGKHFALLMMLNLCIQEEGVRYKSLILQAKERDTIGKLAGDDSSMYISEELKKIAVQLDNLLKNFVTQSDDA